MITGGTATPEAVLAGGRPAAGKTGTTTNSKDAWFVGYTPSLVASVWMGYDPKTPQDKTTLTSVEGVGNVTGGTLPARIWKKFMDATLAGTPNQSFPPPVFGGQPLHSTTTSAPATSVPTTSAPSSTAPTSSAPTTPNTQPAPTTPVTLPVPTTIVRRSTTTTVATQPGATGPGSG